MSDKARLSRARDYPYFLPKQSYSWHANRDDPLHIEPFRPEDVEGRVPVLAVGSNQSPQQLARKYNGKGEFTIPVQRAALQDYDVVFAAHLSAYGAVPAMLQHAPGVEVDLFVTWLDEEQRAIMHATEGNYHYAALDDIALTLDGGRMLDSVHLYVGRLGNLVDGGAAVGLSAISARGRPYRALTTAEMLEIVHRRLAPELALDAFILKLIDDQGFRRACIETIAEDAAPFARPFRVLGTTDWHH